jgi:hypothetical protein
MRKHIEVVIVFTLLTAVAWSAIASGEPEFGTVRLPKDMTIKIRCSIAGTGEPAVLPSGGYNLCDWSISRTDKDGIPWTCEGSVPDAQNVLEVVKERETELPVGEPLVSVLTAVKRGSQVTFSHRLLGRLGETVQIEREGKQLPPKLRIRNADGSYDQSLTFGYG